MTTYLVRTAETNPAGRPSADAAPRTAGSRTAPKKNLSVLTAGILVALTCSILLSLNAIGGNGTHGTVGAAGQHRHRHRRAR